MSKFSRIKKVVKYFLAFVPSINLYCWQSSSSSSFLNCFNRICIDIVGIFNNKLCLFALLSVMITWGAFNMRLSEKHSMINDIKADTGFLINPTNQIWFGNFFIFWQLSKLSNEGDLFHGISLSGSLIKKVSDSMYALIWPIKHVWHLLWNSTRTLILFHYSINMA